MPDYEYKVVNAPRKAQKVKGVRAQDERFARNLSDLMNKYAADGWEYFRAETLPMDEKSGMMGKTTEKYMPLLVFRRPIPILPEVAAVIAEIQAPLEITPPPEEPTSTRNPFVATPSVEEQEPAADFPELGPATRD
ncbi:MAG: DUF4177 domain-containing protein [Paracoccaceae bacterium]